MYYVVYNTLGGDPKYIGSPSVPKMATIKVNVGDGSEDTNVEIPHVSSHTVVLVNFTGTIDTEVFLHLSDDTEVGDLYEIISINTKVNVTNSNIFGIATAERERVFLSIRKVLEDSETTGTTWIGAQSTKPSWI